MNAHPLPATVQMLQLGELPEARTEAHANLLESVHPLHQVKARLQVCVGAATLTVGELLNAKEHQVITLDRQVDQPVDFLLDGKVIARGQLVAAGDYFAVRLTELPLSLKVL